MRRLLRNVPALRRLHHQNRYLVRIAKEVFLTDPVAMNDSSHLEKEWDFATGPDRDRWQRVLQLVAHRRGDRWGDVLEIGCAEGVVTREIAPFATTLIAGDISPVARSRTEDRVRDLSHVQVVPMELSATPLGSHDVVFAMDVLEFIHGRRRLKGVVQRLVEAVRPGGLLVLSMCRYHEHIRSAWWQRWVPEGADGVLPLFAQHPSLELLHQEPHPPAGVSVPDYLDHLIALFGRR